VVEGEVAAGHALTRFEEERELNDPEIAEQIHEAVGTLIAETDPARIEVATARPKRDEAEAPEIDLWASTESE